jgi:ABC-type phosphate transport system substrate-binding protein
MIGCQHLNTFLKTKAPTYSALLLALLLPARLLADHLAITINPPPYINTLSQNEARSIFSMRTQNWPDGSPITVYVMPGRTEIHNNFVKQYLKLLPHQLKRSWDRMIYTGVGQAPVEVRSETEMVERLLSTPGSIGYLPKENVNDQLHIINIE